MFGIFKNKTRERELELEKQKLELEKQILALQYENKRLEQEISSLKEYISRDGGASFEKKRGRREDGKD